MRPSQFALLLLLASQSLFCMNKGKEPIEMEMIPLTHDTDSADHHAIDVQPLQPRSLIELAARAEQRLINSSDTFQMLQSKIDELADPEVKAKVKEWIDDEIEEWQDAVKRSDSNRFHELVHKYLGDAFELPASTPLFAIHTDHWCPPIGKQENIHFTSEYRDHLNECIFNGTIADNEKMALQFKRMQLYSEHIFWPSKKRCFITTAKKIGLWATTAGYIPLQITTSLMNNGGYFFGSIGASIAHLIGICTLEWKTDLSRNQSADHIKDFIVELYHHSKFSNQTVKNIITKRHSDVNAIEEMRNTSRLIKECDTLATKLIPKLEAGLMPSNYEEFRENLMQLYENQNYLVAKQNLERLYNWIEEVERAHKGIPVN